jgi:hypothetical protein
MTSALFGPDGTQPPDPEPALPDALVGPSRTGPPGGYEPSGPSTAPLAGLPLPPLDRDAVQRAINAAMADAQTPAGGLPVQRFQPQRAPNPYASLPPPPSGYRPPPPRQQPPRSQPQRQQPQRQQPPRQQGPRQPQRQQQTRPQTPQRPQGRRQGRRREPDNPLLQARRARGPSGFVGCIVMLIFVVAIAFQPLAALVKTLIELVR